MRTTFYSRAIAVGVAVLLLAPSAFAQIVDPSENVETQKRAQTGMKFLTVPVDARAMALGGAMTAETQGNSSALLYNPASMALMESAGHVNLGMAQYITDINYNAATVAFRPSGGNFGVIGLSFINVDYGEFFETVRGTDPSRPDDGFIETGTYSPTALSIGAGYARSFSDRFSAGAHVKYVMQDLGSFVTERQGGTAGDDTPDSYEEYSVGTPSVDFGVLYNTGFRSLTIAMSTRNFAPELSYVRENFELPLTFQIGLSMNVLELAGMNPNMHSLMLAVDAERPRDFSEHLRVGGEYTFINVLSLRAGMGQAFVGTDQHEEGVSLGAGIHTGVSNLKLGIDYAYTNFGIFGDVNRFAVQFGF